MNRPLVAYVLIMLLVVSVALSVAWYSGQNTKTVSTTTAISYTRIAEPYLYTPSFHFIDALTNASIFNANFAIYTSDMSIEIEHGTSDESGRAASGLKFISGTDLVLKVWARGYSTAFLPLPSESSVKIRMMPILVKPLAVVLDFGNHTQFIDEGFSNRLYSDLVNVSLLHPSVLIIKMNSDGGVGYNTDRGWMWFPIEVGRMIRLFNATSWFYVPTQCISGCWLVSSFATVIAGPGINDFNHTRAEVGNATYDWAYGIASHNNMDGRGIRLATPEYHTNWTTFIAQFSSYQIKTIRA